MTLSPKQAGLKTLDAFADAHTVSHAAHRLQVLRGRCPEFKRDFVKRRPIIAVNALPTAKAPYPVTFAFNRACKLPYPLLIFQNRALLIQFWQGDQTRLLLMNPTIPARSAKAPYFARLRDGLPGSDFLQERVLQSAPIHEQVARLGIRPDQIDYLAFDH